MKWTHDAIKSNGADIRLIYPLAIPMEVMRKPAVRQALISAVADAPYDSIWLKIDNFGDNATGEKTAAYIEACRDFHECGVPLIADFAGGLPSLSALAFGAVSGIAHGVTMQQHFSVSPWRRPRSQSPGGPTRRVYLPAVDMLLKPAAASSLLNHSSRIRGRCGCGDTHCCPRGVVDTIGHPARHAIYQRAREIERLSNTPQTLRVRQLMDNRIRPVSDQVAAIAAVEGLSDTLKKAFSKKQKSVSRFREVMAHFAAASPSTTVAVSLPQRAGKDVRGA